MWFRVVLAAALCAVADVAAAQSFDCATIVSDIASNPNSEGIVLRTKEGTRIPLVLLMFLGGDTQDHLTSLAKETATFRARGYASSNGGQTFFEPSRCVFVHRMPAPAVPAA